MQVALFLHTLADDALRVYNGLQFDNDDSERTVNDIIEKFEDFAVGEVNETYEMYLFKRRCQEEGEVFDKFLSDLRSLIKTCSYCNQCKNSLLRDCIVLGIRDSDTQTELLKVRNLTLKKCIDICKAHENASVKNKILHPESASVNKVGYNAKSQKSDQSESVSNSSFKHCKFCGNKHYFRKDKCPAFGQTCSSCGQENHFASKCPKAQKKKFCQIWC